MKNSFFNYLLVIGLGTFLLACSDRLQVYSDFDPDIDVLEYKTYSWPDRAEIESRTNPLLYNELTDKRIRKAVDEQLLKNGYRQTDTSPDLKVHYHFVVQDKTIELLDNPHLDSYTPYWVAGGKNAYRFQEGTLIIDLMDSKTCNLIWRGWAVSVIEEYKTILSQTEIKEAVIQIFKNYPTHPRK